jgi:hypothetical protein
VKRFWFEWWPLLGTAALLGGMVAMVAFAGGGR